jgi:hypothetical protein
VRAASRVLLLAAIAACTAAGPATAKLPPGIGHFETPSRNIVCDYMSHGSGPSVFCAIKSGLKPPPPRKHCTVGDRVDTFVLLGAKGRATMPSCWGDPGPLVNDGQGTVLAYGRTLRIAHGAIRCRSAVEGLTCRNGKGHGFFLSRKHSGRF